MRYSNESDPIWSYVLVYNFFSFLTIQVVGYFLGLVVFGADPYSGRATFSSSPFSNLEIPSNSHLLDNSDTIGICKVYATVLATLNPILRPVKLPGPL